MTHSSKTSFRRLLAAFCASVLTCFVAMQTTNRLNAHMLSDTDGDGIDDAVDNCPFLSNPAQTDSDGNGTGDACQPVLAAVPWMGDKTKPHVVYSGGTLILQATAWPVGQPGQPVQLAGASWDPGDGSPIQLI